MDDAKTVIRHQTITLLTKEHSRLLRVVAEYRCKGRDATDIKEIAGWIEAVIVLAQKTSDRWEQGDTAGFRKYYIQ